MACKEGAHPHIHSCTLTHALIHVGMHTLMHTHALTHTHVYALSHTCAHSIRLMCITTVTHSHVYTHAHALSHMHTHKHIDVHMLRSCNSHIHTLIQLKYISPLCISSHLFTPTHEHMHSCTHAHIHTEPEGDRKGDWSNQGVNSRTRGSQPEPDMGSPTPHRHHSRGPGPKPHALASTRRLLNGRSLGRQGCARARAREGISGLWSPSCPLPTRSALSLSCSPLGKHLSPAIWGLAGPPPPGCHVSFRAGQAPTLS